MARGSRAIASWSHTYGITDEVTPTPMPAAIATGSSTCGRTAQPPIAVLTGAATSIAAPSPSMPASPGTRDTRCASTMYSENRAALPNANAIPSGSPVTCTETRLYTPATASASANPLRTERTPTAASAITGRNSIADTVPSGSRAIAS